MYTVARLILVVALACASGCTHPDWIEQTLVTVDVTGTWVGASNNRPGGATAGGFETRLELEQQGAKVNGKFRVVGAGIPSNQMTGAGSGPIEGSVAGDVFSFRQTNGPITGEMTVSGDEMTGYMVVGYRIPVSFQRVGSSAPLPSQ